MINGELKRAEVTTEDVMAARWVGQTHPYYSRVLETGFCSGAIDVTEEACAYRELLEIVMCRERQLEIAVSLLSEKDRRKVGA